MKKVIGAIIAVVTLSGCHTDMWVQAKVKALDESSFFKDGAASRPRVPGTLPHHKSKENTPYYTGYQDGKLVKELPLKVTKELLQKGQERYQIFCSNCHGVQGYGNGMITQRGLELARVPASYHTDRLRKMPVGHFFDVMTNGYGIMYPFADRLNTEERWAIAAYIRVLQRSQQGKLEDVPVNDRKHIKNYQKIRMSQEGVK